MTDIEALKLLLVDAFHSLRGREHGNENGPIDPNANPHAASIGNEHSTRPPARPRQRAGAARCR